MAWDTSAFVTDGSITVVAVPEPTTILLGGLAVGGLVLRRRRDQRV